MKLPIRKQAHPVSLILDKWLESDGLFRQGELENGGVTLPLLEQMQGKRLTFTYLHEIMNLDPPVRIQALSLEQTLAIYRNK